MNIGYDAKRIFHNQTGLGNYGRDLIRVLSEYYPAHNYFLYNPKLSRKRLFVTNDSHVFQRLPTSSIDKALSSLWRQNRVIRDLKNDGIQLFHGLSGEIPHPLKKTRIKSTVTIHDLIFMRYPELYKAIDRMIYQRKFSHACHHADKIIAISEQTKADIVEFFRVDPSKIDVIYQGCHPAFKQTYASTQREEILRKFGLPQTFILNVGTIEERKNVLSVVKAMKHVDAHLVIAGRETPYAKVVKEYVHKHNLTNNVSFVHGASTPELAMLYQSASVFVYPSLFEGFGIPIIEALYSGTPVITTAGGCFPEAGGAHSMYISPLAIEEISHAINQLLGDQRKRESMRLDGLAYARQFDDERIANKIMTSYRNTVEH